MKLGRYIIMRFIPISISPHGHPGSLFERFMYGTETIPITTNFTDRRPNAEAEAASRVARSHKVPSGVLPRQPLECKCDKICGTTVNSSSSHSGGAGLTRVIGKLIVNSLERCSLQMVRIVLKFMLR